MSGNPCKVIMNSFIPLFLYLLIFVFINKNRSIVPCQDTGAVKFTFKAEVTHPPELTALCGGVRLSSDNGKTVYEQTVPIPAYLLAIAVGAIVSRPLGKM